MVYLTNSSSQFFRDYLFEHFRILAVISLPQFTFSHYGAGVKSSIVILKKLSQEKTRKIQEKKKEYLEEAYYEHLEDGLLMLESQKAEISKNKTLLKEEKKEQSDIINDKIKDHKEEIKEKAEMKFKRNKKFQYPIFMAIAEHIGYDATGRETTKDDLPQIIEDYKEFYKKFYNGL
ncbi:MAG: hypothetical protein Q9M36_10490 [Sulfurovum sp.]|nr:hypothetical protein [Sulfurovum sp.]